MATYNREQSTVIALWVLARQTNNDPYPPIRDNTAPQNIVDIVNTLGEHHSSDSILLHTHGYDRLLLGRDIDKTVTGVQREVAQELREVGIISRIYDI